MSSWNVLRARSSFRLTHSQEQQKAPDARGAKVCPHLPVRKTSPPMVSLSFVKATLFFARCSTMRPTVPPATNRLGKDAFVRSLLIHVALRLAQMRGRVKALVQFEQARQFLRGIGMIVHTEVDVAIVAAAVAGLVAHDEQGGALPPARITTSVLPGLQRCHEPIGEFAA